MIRMVIPGQDEKPQVYIEQEQHNKLFKDYRIGLECQEFLNSDLGKFIKNRAIEQQDAAMTSLMNAEPEDVKAIRKFQNEYELAAQLFVWLDDAIRAATIAAEAIEVEHNE